MNTARISTLQLACIGLLIFSLSMLPLLGLHIHLPTAHMGNELHYHNAETHGFHVHVSQHDNIDVEPAHPSDTPQINLELDTQLHKHLKILALLALGFILLNRYSDGVITLPRRNYFPPITEFFEIFRAMRRGPPLH